MKVPVVFFVCVVFGPSVKKCLSKVCKMAVQSAELAMSFSAKSSHFENQPGLKCAFSNEVQFPVMSMRGCYHTFGGGTGLSACLTAV